MRPPSPAIRCEPVSASELGATAPIWRRLAERSGDAHFALTPEWLGAWAATASHGALGLLQVGEEAVALVDRRPGGRWAFAGGPATPQRRLLCATGSEDAAWRAVWGWLAHGARPGSELEGVGLPAGIPLPRWASVTEQPSFALELPDTFDAYLRDRSPGTRKGLKAKLRRLEREAAAVAAVPHADRAGALARFVELHGRRAAAKGERHAVVDEHLAALLGALPEEGDVALRLFELRVGDDVAGVTVRLDHRGTSFFYNAGIDPDHGRLSPGVALELASIRDAIERGMRRFDLGPGEYRYKHDLGGVAEPRFRAVVARRSAGGLALRAARAVHARTARGGLQS